MEHRQQIDRDGHEQVRRGWLADPFTMTVNVVCARCNNGWMAQIEDTAKPYLETMLHGHGRQLHEGAQRALAAWALKISLMFEHTQPAGSGVFPSALYAHLREHRQPPDDVSRMSRHLRSYGRARSRGISDVRDSGSRTGWGA